jgi:hypothetical protein
VAAAPGADQVFLNLVSQIGITITDEPSLIYSARTICGDLESGSETPSDAVIRTERTPA